MSLIDSYRSKVIKKGKELTKLEGDKAKESKYISDLEAKINTDKSKIIRTKNETNKKNKQKRIERNQGKLSSNYKKMSSIEGKIRRKLRDLNSDKNKLAEQKEKEAKKNARADKKQQRDSEREIKSIKSSLGNHQKDITKLKDVPEKIKILFITSSPSDQMKLNPDEEVREISSKLRETKYRDSISFITRWAARPLDLIQAINEINPTIIHFSGHGSDNFELAFQDNNGETKLVSKKAIVSTIATATDDVRMVFFSSCFTDQQAKEIVEFVDVSIGMLNEVGDEASRIFASQFYASIGFGQSVSKAFEQARAALMLEGIPEENIPALYIKEGIAEEELLFVNP